MIKDSKPKYGIWYKPEEIAQQRPQIDCLGSQGTILLGLEWEPIHFILAQDCEVINVGVLRESESRLFLLRRSVLDHVEESVGSSDVRLVSADSIAINHHVQDYVKDA